MMRVSEVGRKMIEGFEGCRLEAYRDVVGVLTIGYGHTVGVWYGQKITQAQADALLIEDLDKVYGPGVMAAIGDVPTTQAQFDAMVSLAFNIGVGAFKGSTVCRMHKAGNYAAAADAFSMWNKGGGRVLEPLARRRLTEEKLYLSERSGSRPWSTPAPEKIDARRVGDAVAALQAALGVNVDRLWGPQTQAALDNFTHWRK